MESTLSRDIKRKFKNDVFTNLIKEDIERYGKCMHSINSAYIGIEWALKQSDDIKNLELSNHQVQDILDDMGMIDENGNCPYTAEEIFKAGVEYCKKAMEE